MVKSIPDDEWADVSDAFWEFVPPGKHTDREKMEFVLCAIGTEVHGSPSDVVKAMMVNAKDWVKERTCQYAKPNIVKRVCSCPGGENVLKELVGMQRDSYNVPERVKTDGWVALVELDYIIKCSDPEKVHCYTSEEWVERIKKHIQHIRNVT